nr:hypothetical protein [Clostridia bacterium]
MAAMVNYYLELELDRGASKEQLEQQLKALRKKWISRLNAADTSKRQTAERMVELIREATETLLDDNKRRKYDKDLDKHGSQAPTTQPTSSSSAMINPQSLEGAALLDAIEVYYDESKYNMVIAAARQAIQGGLIEADVFRYLVLSYIEKGDAPNAMRALNEMYDYLPDDPDCQLMAARILLRVMDNHHKDARAFLDMLFQGGYGDNTDVAALDVEYYIDTGDLALAEQKTNEFLSKHPNDSAFKQSVANAYVQYAEANYTVEHGGDWYIDSEDNFNKFNTLITKAQQLYPNPKIAELMKLLKKRQLVPGSWMSWGACFLYAFAGFAAEVPFLGVVCLALGVAMLYFSLVPNWMVERFEYHGHLCGLYEVMRYIGLVASFVFRVGWEITKFIFRLIFAFL